MVPAVAHNLLVSQEAWKTLYAKTLPAAAKSRSKAQKVWPVSLDHCFARIILDNAVGKDVPWMSKIKSPAYKNMTGEQLRDAITMGEGILDGTQDLVVLNQKSLSLRGKKGPNQAATLKRKHEDVANADEDEKKVRIEQVGDTNQAIPSDETLPARVAKEESGPFDISVLNESSDLKPFRKKVLQLLYTVPRGQWTTYKAMSDALSSSPRAVGNAMRNNPYAPYVPCHRVLASDGSIGGFGGSWGQEGVHAKEKIKLLREEGVKFDGKGKVVGRPFTFSKN
jgi:O-6-methylguanine DNA methyltransferase